MYLTIFQIVAALSVFTLSLLAGLLPLKISTKHAHHMHLGDALASGIFISAALLHLLPEANHGFAHMANHYPIAGLICVAVFILLLAMERVILIYGTKHFTNKKFIVPLLLVSLLAIHSLVEGAAIGSNNNILEAALIFFAVIAHKGSESMALTINLLRYHLTPKNIVSIIALFACITPAGIFIASMVTSALQTTSGTMLSSAFNAIAAGTFLYLGTEHLIECKKSFETFKEVIALAGGIALMAIVAIWV